MVTRKGLVVVRGKVYLIYGGNAMDSRWTPDINEATIFLDQLPEDELIMSNAVTVPVLETRSLTPLIG